MNFMAALSTAHLFTFLCRNTMAWTLFAISRYPDIQARVERELDDLGLLASPLNPNPRDLTVEDLDRVPYLCRVIKESMRIYPVAFPWSCNRLAFCHSSLL
jgi:cytochrome P450